MNYAAHSVGLATALALVEIGVIGIVQAGEISSHEMQLEKRFQILDQDANGVIDNREAKADVRLNAAFDRFANKTLDKPRFPAWSKVDDLEASKEDLGD